MGHFPQKSPIIGGSFAETTRSTFCDETHSTYVCVTWLIQHSITRLTLPSIPKNEGNKNYGETEKIWWKFPTKTLQAAHSKRSRIRAWHFDDSENRINLTWMLITTEMRTLRSGVISRFASSYVWNDPFNISVTSRIPYLCDMTCSTHTQT